MNILMQIRNLSIGNSKYDDINECDKDLDEFFLNQPSLKFKFEEYLKNCNTKTE